MSGVCQVFGTEKLNSVSEVLEGNVTSYWLCDGKKLVAVSLGLTGTCCRVLTHSGNSFFPNEIVVLPEFDVCRWIAPLQVIVEVQSEGK